MIELVAGIEFNGARQDDCELSVMLAESEVHEAIARGEIPRSPMNSAIHTDHGKEKRVQAYLGQHGLHTGLEYQSLFVGWGPATAVGEVTVRKYGFPFVVKPEVAHKLSIACLGDLQTVVKGLKRGHGAFPPDDRIVNLNTVSDTLKVLEQLSLQAQEHNAKVHSNFIYVEARLYRVWKREDLERPCTPNDYWKKQSASCPPVRRIERAEI
jgi:hypothetical protein